MRRYRLSLGFLGLGLALCLWPSPTAQATYSAVGQSPYNGGRAKDFSLIKNGNQWVIVAINDPVPWPPLDQPESAGLPVSTSYDLEHWTYQGVAVPVGTAGSWDDRAAWAPSIIKSGDTWYLYYAGVHVVGGTLVQKIGLSTSTDTIHWTKYESNPVFDCSTLPWVYWNVSDGNGASCRDPFVIRDEANNQWLMFFSATLPHDATPPYTNIPNPSVVGLATSTDLIHWVDAGMISATKGPTAESPHAFVHNGTWWLVYTTSCNFNGATKCLQYSTASALTGPYSGQTDFPDVTSYHFASEYYRDPVTGQEIFGRVGNGNIPFSEMDWTSGSLTLHLLPLTRFTGNVFNDRNRNGIQDPDEPGISGVKLHFYLDDGDGLFNATLDHELISTVTRRIIPDGIPQDGFYTMSDMPRGTDWVAIGSENYLPSAVLDGLTPTTPNGALSYAVTQNDTLTGMNLGVALPDTTPPSAVQDLSVR